MTFDLHRRARRATAVSLGAALLFSPMAHARVAQWATTLTPAYVPDGARAIGTLVNGAPMQVVLGLKLHNRSELDALVAEQSRVGSPSYRRFLTPAQFAARYSPTEAEAQAVAGYLTKAGFRNVTVSANRLLVSAEGSAATVRAAFSTELAEYDLNGRRVYANTLPAKVPAELAGSVLAVTGLQNASQGHTMLQRAQGVTPNATVSGFYPLQFAHLYSADTLPAATNVPVAIFAEGSLTQALADFAQFESANSITPIPVSVTTVNGGSSDTSGTAEWDLDSQDIVGMSGGVQSITFYAGPSLSYTDMTAEFNQIVVDDAAPVINVSIGGCEIGARSSGTTPIVDQILLQGTVQGQTFFVSSGDSGSAECGRIPGQSWPAISPYVTAVGGTALIADSNGNYSSETTWSGTGGGPSVTEAKPSYQSGVTMKYNSRGVPDIAFDASPSTGAKIIVNGSYAQYGGTSLAAPLAAGAWARLTGYCSCGFSIGFATPAIYTAVGYESWIVHDVTKGSNGGYSATTGWDYTTGLGSLIVNLYPD